MKDQLEQPSQLPAESTAPSADSSGSNIVAFHQPAGAGPKLRRRPGKHTSRPQRPASQPARPPRPAQPAHSARPASAGSSTPQRPLPADEDDGFFEKHRAKIIVGAMLLMVGGAIYFLGKSKGTVAPKAPEKIVSVSIAPPPPPLPKPPPPPPPKAPPPDQKMVAETAPTEKPAEAPKPKAPEPAALATGIKGPGPGSGLASSGNGLGGGTFGGNTGGGGSRFGFYAGQVQTRVAEALRHNSKTKTASMKIQVRIWPDNSGHVTRAKLDNSTGDTKLDQAIEKEVLDGLQLDPPPAGMPTPIVLRLTARRP